jgi:hypothetical protein
MRFLIIPLIGGGIVYIPVVMFAYNVDPVSAMRNALKSETARLSLQRMIRRRGHFLVISALKKKMANAFATPTVARTPHQIM